MVIRRSAGFPEFGSHQLSASLVAIKGSAATVLGSLHPMDSRETRHFLQIIEDHADHVRQLIGNLSNLRDMKSGTLSVTPELTNMADLVAEATEAFLRRGAKNTLLLDPAPRLMVDMERTLQVLDILVTDVSKNSPPSSVIQVSLSGAEADDQVRVKISTVSMTG